MQSAALAGLALLILGFDIALPLGVAGGVPYVLVVLLAARLQGEWPVWLAAGSTSVLTGFGLLLSPEGSVPWQVLTNRFLALFAIWVTAILSIHLKKSQTRTALALQQAHWSGEQSRLRDDAETERARVQAILEASPAAVVVVDAEGHVLLANDEAATIHGRTVNPGEAHEALHRRITLLRPDGSAYSDDELPLNRALHHRELVRDLEVIFQRQDGAPVSTLISAAPVVNHAGKVIAAVSVFQDISRLKQMETVRDEFLSRVTHDLRGPLATMRSIATAAIEAPPVEHEEFLEDMRLILEEGERMAELVTNLLDITRIETGALKPERELAYIQDIVAEAIRRMSGSKLGQDRAMNLDVSGDLPPVTIDPVMIRRVLENLLSNALKYSEGEVLVRTSVLPESSAIVVSVADSGPGVPPEKRALIFDKFSSGATASQSSGLGAGMGLAVSKAILDAHKGKIWVEGEPGEGATFCFLIPARSENRAASQTALTESS